MSNTNYFREKRLFSNENMTSNALFAIQDLQLDEQAIQAYLKLGYVPGCSTLFQNISCEIIRDVSLKDIFKKLPEIDHSPSELHKILKGIISDLHSPVSNPQYVVPLSGGMDSRIVLAALCEFTETKNIHTYTFGVPGSYDYEIPNKIAKNLGTQHTNFSSKQTIYSIDGLVRAAIASDGNTEVFHPLVLNRVADYYGPDAIYWSGFGGDVVGGAFGDKLIGNNPKQQLIDYEKRGIHFLEGLVEDKSIYSYISLGEKMGSYISEAEACFWENHMERYTGHHIFRNDMNIKAPPVDARLLKFFFTLPKSQRENKKFFNESFTSIYPEIFDIPTKDYGYKYSRYSYKQPFRKARFYTKASGWRLAPKLITHPHTAYIDMQYAINERPDVKNCIDELLSDLSHRNIIDNKRMFKFLSQHREGSKNYTKDIINLASLEVILKAANL